MLDDEEHGAGQERHEAGRALRRVAEAKAQPEERHRPPAARTVRGSRPERDEAHDDEEGHHHVGQGEPGVPVVAPGGREDQRAEQPRPGIEHPPAEEQRGPDAGDTTQGGGQDRGQLGHVATGQRERGDRPDEERRLLHVDVVADPRHEPVARLDHVARQQRIPRLVPAVEDRRADPAIVRRMTATLRHRGPDDEGYYVDGQVALGHRRLQIIDLTTGHQPIANETGTVHAILNGEIYNYRRLAEQLRARGHRFTTSSDTEVIVHAWEEFGEDCLAEFDGMFAFVIWDAERQTLFAARDRMGEKPFYYAERNGWFVFGSELRALLAHPEIRRDLDLRSVARYLGNGYVPDPHTILAGVQKLPPGHFLHLTAGKVRVGRYWDLPFAVGEPRPTSDAGWSHALWDSLCTSVKNRLVSDVPVGIFLSGGLDSSATTAAAVTVAPGQKFKTFSIGFEETTYNEEPYARAVAERLGTEHRQFTFTSGDAAALFPRLGELLDEPLADPAFLPTVHLARHIREWVTVALSGDGGDELLCGYPTFLAVKPMQWVNRLPAGLISAAGRGVEVLPGSTRYGSPSFLLKQFFRGAVNPFDVAAQIMMNGLTPDEQASLVGSAVRAANVGGNPYDDVVSTMSWVPTDDPIRRLVYHRRNLSLAALQH